MKGLLILSIKRFSYIPIKKRKYGLINDKNLLNKPYRHFYFICFSMDQCKLFHVLQLGYSDRRPGV